MSLLDLYGGDSDEEVQPIAAPPEQHTDMESTAAAAVGEEAARSRSLETLRVRRLMGVLSVEDQALFFAFFIVLPCFFFLIFFVCAGVAALFC